MGKPEDDEEKWREREYAEACQAWRDKREEWIAKTKEHKPLMDMVLTHYFETRIQPFPERL